MLEGLRERGFELAFASHAAAILATDFREVVEALEATLAGVRLPITEIIGSGGGEAQVTQRLRRGFHELGWRKRNVEIKKIVDGIERESISHEIDHFLATLQGNFALEIEWNNKDPFFDRDLENFKRLHAEGVIGVGSIVTRGPALQAELRHMIGRWAHREAIESFDDLRRRGFKRPTERQEALVAGRMVRGDSFPDAWAAMFASDKFGMATTHWSKLQDRIRRGVGNPCPLLLIGLPAAIVDIDA
ncbi:Restriction endonuclease BglII [Novosphingobium sp. CF614]|uniref:BglII/BstYI family type II restriction endonuclease n=1 Tax=Novosphingobium sp. CF614 TaxID=1884364 RepID=UPI0008E95223|nr:BglII/BstYI family type II restriction endonuclease [Novosphingobium sp. CF614]SFG33648.1 Restriction endonuclease BglII [Novosphingobium sp. CF614]